MYVYDIKCVDFPKYKIVKIWTNEKKYNYDVILSVGL
jgi:hypothetical protein